MEKLLQLELEGNKQTNFHGTADDERIQNGVYKELGMLHSLHHAYLPMPHDIQLLYHSEYNSYVGECPYA